VRREALPSLKSNADLHLYRVLAKRLGQDVNFYDLDNTLCQATRVGFRAMKLLLRFILKTGSIALLVFLCSMVLKPLAKDYWVLVEGTKPDSFFSDYQHAKQPECTVVNVFMLTHCDFVYQSLKDPADTHDIFTFMLGPVSADEVYFVESARSGIVSTNYQLDHMINRTISAILLVFLALAACLGILAAGYVPSNDTDPSVQKRKSV
jgi:hypothetical protein